LILDGEDNVIGKEEYLLPNATSISIEDVPDAMRSFGGICYPAHIDRMSNGIIAVLGTLPPSPSFSAIELHSRDKQAEYERIYDLSGKKIVISSDAHYLQDIRDAENSILLPAEKDDPDAVRRELINALGGAL
jgi:hypothetical protein